MSVSVLDRIIELYLVPYFVCNQLCLTVSLFSISYLVILFATFVVGWHRDGRLYSSSSNVPTVKALEVLQKVLPCDEQKNLMTWRMTPTLGYRMRVNCTMDCSAVQLEHSWPFYLSFHTDIFLCSVNIIWILWTTYIKNKKKCRQVLYCWSWQL